MLLKHAELTCNAIMKDMSAPTIEQPFNRQIIEKYVNY